MTTMIFQTSAGEVRVEVNDIHNVYEIYNALAESHNPVIAAECVELTINEEYTLG